MQSHHVWWRPGGSSCRCSMNQPHWCSPVWRVPRWIERDKPQCCCRRREAKCRSASTSMSDSSRKASRPAWEQALRGIVRTPEPSQSKAGAPSACHAPASSRNYRRSSGVLLREVIRLALSSPIRSVGHDQPWVLAVYREPSRYPLSFTMRDSSQQPCGGLLNHLGRGLFCFSNAGCGFIGIGLAGIWRQMALWGVRSITARTMTRRGRSASSVSVPYRNLMEAQV